jgi:hypothetical protein
LVINKITVWNEGARTFRKGLEDENWLSSRELYGIGLNLDDDLTTAGSLL